jgi:hypothetical protein
MATLGLGLFRTDFVNQTLHIFRRIALVLVLVLVSRFIALCETPQMKLIVAPARLFGLDTLRVLASFRLHILLVGL